MTSHNFCLVFVWTTQFLTPEYSAPYYTYTYQFVKIITHLYLTIGMTNFKFPLTYRFLNPATQSLD